MSAPSTSILDTFSGTLGSWTQNCWGTSGSNFSISSGHAVASDSAAMLWTSAFTPGDLECFVTLVNGPHNGAEARLILSNQSPDLQGYDFQVGNDAGAWNIYKWSDNDSWTLLDNGVDAMSAGDKIGFQRLGNNIIAWLYTSGDWVQLSSINDTTYMNLQYIGLRDDGAVNIYDDFGGGIPITITLDTCLPDADITTTGWT